MAVFEKGAVITESGFRLIADAISGKTITFTKMVTSKYNYDDSTNYEKLTEVVQVVQTSSVSYNKRNPTTVDFYARFTNEELKETYKINLIGLYAKDETGTEYLFSTVRPKTGTADTMPSFNGLTVSSTSYSFLTAVGNADNVTVEVGDGSVSQLEFDELKAQLGEDIQEINNKIGDLSKLTTKEKSNLVLAINEVLKTTVDNKIVIINNLIDGGTDKGLSAEQGKVLKNIIDTHIGNKSNPHGVTKKQVGLENVADYGVSTQAEAETGTSNSKYMTPLRTKQSIEKLSPKVEIVNNLTDGGINKALSAEQGKVVKKEIDSLKQSGNERNSELVANLISKNVQATADDSLKTNIEKVKTIPVGDYSIGDTIPTDSIQAIYKKTIYPSKLNLQMMTSNPTYNITKNRFIPFISSDNNYIVYRDAISVFNSRVLKKTGDGGYVGWYSPLGSSSFIDGDLLYVTDNGAMFSIHDLNLKKKLRDYTSNFNAPLMSMVFDDGIPYGMYNYFLLKYEKNSFTLDKRIQLSQSVSDTDLQYNLKQTSDYLISYSGKDLVIIKKSDFTEKYSKNISTSRVVSNASGLLGIIEDDIVVVSGNGLSRIKTDTGEVFWNVPIPQITSKEYNKAFLSYNESELLVRLTSTENTNYMLLHYDKSGIKLNEVTVKDNNLNFDTIFCNGTMTVISAESVFPETDSTNKQVPVSLRGIYTSTEEDVLDSIKILK